MSGLSAQAYGALLVFARVLPIALLSVAWKRGLASSMVALSWALALSVGLSDRKVVDTGDVLALVLPLARELLLGGAYALAVAVPFVALRMGLRAVESSVGRSPRALWSDLYVYVAVLLALSLGADRALLSGLVAGLGEAPAGSATPLDLTAFLTHVAAAVSDAFAFALSLALPLLVAIALTDLTAAMLQRVTHGPGQAQSHGPLRSLAVMLILSLLVASVASRTGGMLREAIDRGRAWVREASGA